MVDLLLEDLEQADRMAGAALFEQRVEDAEAIARAALGVHPSSWDLRNSLGRALMMQGRWAEGWPLMEYRSARRVVGPTKLPYPEWRGEALQGKSILVWGEQGLGDEIMFARFVAMLRGLGPARISLACHQLNLRSFANLGADALISHTAEKVSVPRHDFWVLLGSLPGLLHVTPENLTGLAYLPTPAVARRRGVGLVERGNPRHPNDRFRSLPVGALQAAVPSGRLLEPQGDTLDSLAQLAALDLLITVDTSWAHMAAAVGLPCWILLSSHGLDWRWMTRRADTPWGRSLRLFRQTAPGDWGSALDQVVTALRAGGPL